MPRSRLPRWCVAAVLAYALGVGAGTSRADSDVQQWNELGVSYGLSKQTSVSFDQHLRFDEDLSRVEAVMPEPGIQYRLRRWLRLGAGYRLQYARGNDDDLRVRHRFHVNARLRQDIDRVRLDYRLQLQEQLRPGAKEPVRHTVRHRVEVAYREYKPWIPAASVEGFVGVANGDPVHLDRVWLTIGGSHDRKQRTIDAFYRVEVPIEQDSPTLHIFGLGVHFDR
jgi:hypothetical protein